MIKSILVGFLLLTAAYSAIVACLAYMGVIKSRMDKEKTDEDHVIGFAASIIAWLVAGLFLFFAYLAS